MRHAELRLKDTVPPQQAEVSLITKFGSSALSLHQGCEWGAQCEVPGFPDVLYARVFRVSRGDSRARFAGYCQFLQGHPVWGFRSFLRCLRAHDPFSHFTGGAKNAPTFGLSALEGRHPRGICCITGA